MQRPLTKGTFDYDIAKLIEECGELAAACLRMQHVACKLNRFGFDRKNDPKLRYPDKARVLINAMLEVRSEMSDVLEAMDAMSGHLAAEMEKASA